MMTNPVQEGGRGVPAWVWAVVTVMVAIIGATGYVIGAKVTAGNAQPQGSDGGQAMPIPNVVVPGTSPIIDAPQPDPTTEEPAPEIRRSVDLDHDPSIIANWRDPSGNVTVRIPEGYDSVWIVSWKRGVTFNGRYEEMPTTLVSKVDVRVSGLQMDTRLGHLAIWAVAFKGWSAEEILSSETYGCDKGVAIMMVDSSGKFSKYTGHCGNMD